ncbi:MAG: hypothetical protein PUE08_04700 [Eubacteriales bacterium]|nr:hypothetical protein [Eubacteriales bacterium]
MKNKNNTGKAYCLISAVIIIGCYAVQRLLSLGIGATKTLVLLEAMAFSLAVAAVYFLIMKSGESFYGILISLLGFKMLPPSIGGLRELSPGGYIVYFVVTKAAIVLFAFAIIRLFREQKYEQKIKTLPILFLMTAVPFTNKIAAELSAFANTYADGNRLYEYFICFAFYALTMIVTLWYASKSNTINAKLMCDYTVIALAVNFARRICVVIVYALRGWHISKSYFCWIAIYLFFIVAFYMLRRKKIKL